AWRGIGRLGAGARGAGRVGGDLFCDRAQDFPVAMTNTGDLSGEQLITSGRAVLEWIASYLDHPEKYPVLSQSKPGEIKASLASTPPAAGEPLSEILADFESKIIPGITHWNHPAFFAYFATSSNVPAILAEMLVATLDVKA